MDSKTIDWGHFEITLDRYLKQLGMSKNRLADMANLQKTQLTAYCRNQVQRPDLHVLARICLVLECDISDIMKYIPPKDPKRLLQAKQRSVNIPVKKSDPVQIYKTAELAREVGVHPNTIRFYENAGLISQAPRENNGYRIFTVRHLYQIRICRCILGIIWTGRVIRASAMKILEAMREWDISKAMSCAQAHMKLVEKEYATALETAAILKQWADKGVFPQTGRFYSRQEVSVLVGVTMEILRNWERNGLIAVPRTGVNKTRLYGDAEIARLRVIYMLRQTNYSVSAIHRSLALHDHGNAAGAVLALNQPESDDEIMYVSAGDHWLESLSATADLARKMISIIKEI
jgi:DNA-binding transcriptional MerR regulator/DNA-binding Xre family transcriptional regulator